MHAAMFLQESQGFIDRLCSVFSLCPLFLCGCLHAKCSEATGIAYEPGEDPNHSFSLAVLNFLPPLSRGVLTVDRALPVTHPRIEGCRALQRARAAQALMVASPLESGSLTRPGPSGGLEWAKVYRR